MSKYLSARYLGRSFPMAIAIIFAPAPLYAANPITPIVRTGDPIPGEAPGTKFTYFGAPSINSAGVIAFRSQANQFGIFTGTEGGLLTRIAVSSDKAPGLPAGSTFELFDENIPINSHGAVAFTSIYNDPTHPTGSSRGAWSNPGGVFQKVITVGDPLPGHPTGGTFDNFAVNSNPVVFTDSGLSAYSSWTSTFPAAARWGIWAGVTKASTVKVALADDPAPTLAANTFFNAIDYPVINSAGTLAFHASVTGSGTGFYERDLIYAGAAGNIKPLVRANTAAPGTTALFSSFQNPDISSTGKVAFHASLDSRTSPFFQSDGIWAGTAGNLTLVARSGTVAPGTVDATFSSGFGDPLINAGGTVSFTNQLTSGGNVNSDNFLGLWSGLNPNNLTLVARTGDHAPDTPDGVKFAWPSAFPHVLNNLGQVAFTASLIGTGVNDANDSGIWVYDPLKGTHLIVREGQTIDIAPGISKTISSIVLRTGASSGDGRATSLNDNGQLAFSAGFTGGIYYGEFIANIGGTLPGDANQDAAVDMKDFAIMMAHYDKPGAFTFATGDFNADTKVNFADFQIFERNFGKSSLIASGDIALASSVPEPASIAALSVMATAALLRHRRTR